MLDYDSLERTCSVLDYDSLELLPVTSGKIVLILFVLLFVFTLLCQLNM